MTTISVSYVSERLGYLVDISLPFVLVGDPIDQLTKLRLQPMKSGCCIHMYPFKAFKVISHVYISWSLKSSNNYGVLVSSCFIPMFWLVELLIQQALPFHGHTSLAAWSKFSHSQLPQKNKSTPSIHRWIFCPTKNLAGAWSAHLRPRPFRASPAWDVMKHGAQQAMFDYRAKRWFTHGFSTVEQPAGPWVFNFLIFTSICEPQSLPIHVKRTSGLVMFGGSMLDLWRGS